MKPLATFGRAVLVAWLTTAVWSSHALGQDAPQTPPDGVPGAEIRKRGNEAMEARRFGEAVALYAQAYAISKDPALLYNHGRALQALGQFPEALAQLERFEVEAPAELKARVPGLSRMVADLRSRIAVVTLKSNISGAQVFAKNTMVGTTPLGAPIRLNAGKITIEVVAEGYEPYHAALDLAGGTAIELEARLVAKGAFARQESGAVARADGKSAPDESKPITSQWWFWTGAGIVVAGGAVLAAALLVERPAERGDIPPGQVPISLVRF